MEKIMDYLSGGGNKNGKLYEIEFVPGLEDEIRIYDINHMYIKSSDELINTHYIDRCKNSGIRCVDMLYDMFGCDKCIMSLRANDYCWNTINHKQDEYTYIENYYDLNLYDYAYSYYIWIDDIDKINKLDGIKYLINDRDNSRKKKESFDSLLNKVCTFLKKNKINGNINAEIWYYGNPYLWQEHADLSPKFCDKNDFLKYINRYLNNKLTKDQIQSIDCINIYNNKRKLLFTTYV